MAGEIAAERHHHRQRRKRGPWRRLKHRLRKRFDARTLRAVVVVVVGLILLWALLHLLLPGVMNAAEPPPEP